MALFTQSELAREIGVSPQAINKAVKTGALVKDSNGKIDSLVPKNKDYIDQVKYRNSLQLPSTGKVGAPPNDLVRQGREIKNKLDQIKVARERIKYYEEIGKSIPVSVVARSLSKMTAVLNEQFGMFADRHSAYLFAIAKTEKTETEFREQIDIYIQESLKVVVENISNSVSKYKEREKGDDYEQN